MDDEEFGKRMPIVDEELKKRGLLPHQRPWHAIDLVSPGFSGIVLGASADLVAASSGPYEGPNLFRAICRWYNDMYGDRMKGIGPISRVPILIRSEIYMATVPLVFGRCEIAVQKLLKDVTPVLFDDLSDHELADVCIHWREGFELEYEIWVMHGPDYLPLNSMLKNPGVEELMQSALQDRDAAVDALGKPNRFPTALFHSQQLAEKSLKAVLRSIGMGEERLREIGHKLSKLYEKCSPISSIFGMITKEVEALSLIGMNVRYDNPTVSPLQAASVYWAGLRVCALSTCVICRINRRVIKGVTSEDSAKPTQTVEGVMTYRNL